MSGIFLGWRLRSSIKKLIAELKSGNVSNNTLGEVITHIVWRFTRIGIFAIIATLIPISFLAIQSYLLYLQNKKIDNQNNRIEQQIYLQEAERRSSLVFLFNNVLDRIDNELKDPSNLENKLSQQLIGRIITLSKAIRPYRYLEDDKLISTPVSPERAHLMISLIESQLDSSTYGKIFEKSDFSSALLRKADLKEREIINADLWRANLTHSDLCTTNLTGSYMARANFEYAKLQGANLTNADLTRANLSNASFEGANILGTDFRAAQTNNADFLEYLHDNCIGADSVLIKYFINPNEFLLEGKDTTYFIQEHNIK
ncbi:MAG: pentapeptide repeat-containing protein [Bacteroidota bacterium]